MVGRRCCAASAGQSPVLLPIARGAAFPRLPPRASRLALPRSPLRAWLSALTALALRASPPGFFLKYRTHTQFSDRLSAESMHKRSGRSGSSAEPTNVGLRCRAAQISAPKGAIPNRPTEPDFALRLGALGALAV